MLRHTLKARANCMAAVQARFFTAPSDQRGRTVEPQPYMPSEGSASDLDADDILRAKMDPMKGQVYDFLRNVSVYEE